MKGFDSVVIGCDTAFGMVKTAETMRTILESYSIRVYLYTLVQKQHALDFLARQHPQTEYVILCCHGEGSTEDAKLRLEVIDNIEGQRDRHGREKWEDIKFYLTPQNIPELVKNAHGTFITIACAGGRQSLADAFLSTGYKSYIAPTDWNDAGLLFVSALFHHLLAEDREDPVFPAVKYSNKEAVALAAMHDVDIKDSIQSFKCFE